LLIFLTKTGKNPITGYTTTQNGSYRRLSRKLKLIKKDLSTSNMGQKLTAIA